MWIRLSLLALLWFSAAGADDFKIIKLEQDVRNLERQVNELNRQVAALQRRSPSTDVAAVPRERDVPEANDNPLWYSRANWDRVRVGMDELEVICLLGKPTSVRGSEGEARTLFYAVEIGTAAFLGGSVELRDRRVTEVKAPVLK